MSYPPFGMHLELMRERATEFPPVSDPTKVTSARIWHCRYESLAPVAQLTRLRALEIATYPDATLDHLATLASLERLQLVHLPRVSDLSPLSKLTSLRYLELSTLPSWDASGKVTEVESLALLATLPKLEEVHLFGVRPKNRRIDDLLRAPSLRRARLSKYPQKEIERLERFLETRGKPHRG